MSLMQRLLLFFGTFPAALLAIFLVDDGGFVQIAPTAVATFALLCSLPMVDSALFGKTVHPALGGAVLGWSLGFFVRQSAISTDLFEGAHKVLGAAFAVSIILMIVRFVRARRQRA